MLDAQDLLSGTGSATAAELGSSDNHLQFLLAMICGGGGDPPKL